MAAKRSVAKSTVKKAIPRKAAAKQATPTKTSSAQGAAKQSPAKTSAKPSAKSAGRAYWLIKSEPDVFSIDDLARDGETSWEGVRNYQARNHLRSMKAGDLALFYHSSAEPSGVAGVARISREAYPDDTQFDPESRYHDPDSDRDDPRWSRVDVEFVERFAALVPLSVLKEDAALDGMLVRKRGMRLSVQPVEPEHFAHVLELGESKLRV